ncbi:MAG: FAD-binding oxidoreductase [Erysipelothrix sp.]|nr:FAD-binding oxidoreductase [Erysipelothrix sp.]
MDKNNIFFGDRLSLWLKDGISTKLVKLNENLECDVCVVGAGITGITTAYRLMESGLKVVLIDKSLPLNLASGNTTAKFTFQHGLVYHKIIENYGLSTAKLFYSAQQEGLKYVRHLISKHNIECDFKETAAIVYAESEKDFEEIEKEVDAYKQLEIPYKILTKFLNGIKIFGGLNVDNQLELNPVKYLDSMLKVLLKNQVSVFKDTEATLVKKNDNFIEVTTKDNYKIKCQKLVVATAYPFY